MKSEVDVICNQNLNMYLETNALIGYTLFFEHLALLDTAEVWSTSSSADVCRCGPQTKDLFLQKKQTAPKIVREVGVVGEVHQTR
ncbi:hypothetical protein QVD17_10536 [Tagetes erecta]|uniref:Uncharacterized protein n=1 Tax=Tagetes erecta TaxID=13708 RepID=A0AAD8P4V6_TARER|nr:hypothetical protein QVD17_10536 [Tagetes erecta]